MQKQETMIGENVPFNRIRRITGYLVGDVSKRFNNAKRSEEHDRVKHTYSGSCTSSHCGN
ncbi:MAG: anaerobic ribonucleoside-triphosphate reductase [Desulfovibrionaceae bacterium]|jgi:hypothetical protein|nr:anaerobic ribonucleoside-triphosphate reductase [Desulfovibrionaceae bacterium]